MIRVVCRTRTTRTRLPCLVSGRLSKNAIVETLGESERSPRMRSGVFHRYRDPGVGLGGKGASSQRARTLVCRGSCVLGAARKDNMTQEPGLLMTMLGYINESTKWVVSALVFVMVLGRRDEKTAWCVIGGVMTAFVCRVLKYAINASRPASSVRSDPGMPSSHASTLAFLTMFPFLMLLEKPGGYQYVSAWCLPVGGLVLTSLRVVLGYHTIPQITVGWILGASMAYLWVRLGVDHALPWLMSSLTGRAFLGMTTCAFMALFAVKNVRRWMKESTHDDPHDHDER